MKAKENLVFVERDGDAIGVFHDYEDANEYVKDYLSSYLGLSVEAARQCMENNDEEDYMIYYHETCMYEKEGKVYDESLG